MEIFEFLAIIWYCVFSKASRKALLEDWNKEKKVGKFVIFVEIAMSAAANLLLIYFIVLVLSKGTQ